MERTSTTSERPLAKAGSGNSIVGQLEALDQVGQAFRIWNLVQARCTIGSSAESIVCVDDSSMAGVHALIVFGKNHSLIRALGGQVRIAGRNVREWLIDEPTMIQCGATRMVVYPPGFLNSTQSLQHRVAPGSVADQASRLRTPVQASVAAPISSVLSSTIATAAQANFASSSETRSIETPKAEPTFVVAKLDPVDVQAALEPLHRAVQEASEGILAMTRHASESAAQFDALPPASDNLSEVTQAIESLDVRVSAITQHCESMIANVSDSIEGRLNRLDEFLLRLAETPTAPHPISISSRQLDRADDQPELESPYAGTLFEEPTDVSIDSTQQVRHEGLNSDCASPFDTYFPETQYLETQYSDPNESEVEFPEGSFSTPEYPATQQATVPDESMVSLYEADDESVQEQNHQPEEIQPESPKSTLPSWFTEEEPNLKSSENESSGNMPASSSWTSAQLNPIYAEDTHSWLTDVDSDQNDFVDQASNESHFESHHDQSPSVSDEETIPSVDSFERFGAEAYQEIGPEIASDTYEEKASLPTENAIEHEFHASQNELLASEVDEQDRRYEETIPSPAASLESNPVEVSEESIEDYMSRLLQRVKGTPGTDSPATLSLTHVTKPKETVSKQATVEGIGDPKSADESGAPLEQPTFEAGEFAPRKAAPERSENLAALRTLANDTARQAFQNISRKRLQMSLIGKCAVSGLGLLGGLFLLVLNGFNANVAMIGMIASFVVCLLWGYEAMVLFKQLQIVKAKEASEIANV